MSHVAPTIQLTVRQKEILTKISRSRSLPKSLICRAQIVLFASAGLQNKDISDKVNLNRLSVGLWRKRWHEAEEILKVLEAKEDEAFQYKQKIAEVLTDNERPGSPPTFTAEQVCQLLSVACEKPEDSNVPVSHWSYRVLTQEVIKRGIVPSISKSSVGRFLKSGRY